MAAMNAEMVTSSGVMTTDTVASSEVMSALISMLTVTEVMVPRRR